MWDLVAGRQTGSEGWRAARGELGNPPSSSSSIAANGTAFRMADDGSVQSSEPGRLCGGVVRASGEHLPDQIAVRVRLCLLRCVNAPTKVVLQRVNVKMVLGFLISKYS